jgi:hypothetical protein
MADPPATTVFHSYVPHKHRLMMLIGFIRSHLSDTIIVACAGSAVAEFNSILTNNLDIRSGAAEINVISSTENSAIVQGKQKQSQRAAAVDRFNSGKVNLLFGSAFVLSSIDLTRRPTWVLHYEIPKSIEEETRLIQRLNPLKFLILLDASESEYIKELEIAKITSKELAFDEKKIPKLRNQVISLCKKNYPLYMCGQMGYKELIGTYVNHECGKLFDAMRLPLLDVAINFGIEAPPKLPLKRP